MNTDRLVKKMRYLQDLMEFHCEGTDPGDCKMPERIDDDNELGITSDCTGCKNVVKSLIAMITDDERVITEADEQTKHYLVAVLNDMHTEVMRRAKP